MILKTNNNKKSGGFTLVEILVAIAILTAILVLMVGLSNNTANLTNLSSRKISADAESRQALDRISSDLDRIVLRRDLPQDVKKNDSAADRNDALTIYALVDGYNGNRGISKVGYHVSDGKLQRGVEGSFWEKATGADQLPQLPFGAGTPPTIPDADFDVMAADIFRFELAFLMEDGSIKASTSGFLGNTPAERIRAIIVGVAALDTKTRKMMTGDINTLATLLPDAKDSQDILSVWSEELNDPAFYSVPANDSFPAVVRSAIQIHQRYIYIVQ